MCLLKLVLGSLVILSLFKEAKCDVAGCAVEID